MTFATFFQALLLGWSVAWPPGPINAEMIRRGLLPKERGGGFAAAWAIALGAGTGDFLWAFAVSLGAGAVLNSIGIRRVLAVFSLGLLLFLAYRFAAAAWKLYRTHRLPDASMSQAKRARGGFLLGFVIVLTSPWNVGFWLAVIGSQPNLAHSVQQSIAFAAAVVFGATLWGVILSLTVRFGARIFARPAWQIGTQALTALLMLWFAVRLLRNFP